MRVAGRRGFEPAIPAPMQHSPPFDDGMESVWRWVCPREIQLDVHARNKREVLAAVASLCAQSLGLPPAPILRALWRREQAGSTGLDHGVALPHARITGIEHPLTMFVRTTKPIEFRSPDGEPVSQLFVILVPEQRPSDEHLVLLARIAEMLTNRDLRSRVATASSAAVVHSIFAQWVVRHRRSE